MSRVSAAFTDNQVFADAKINTVCDQIMRVVDKYRPIATTSDFSFYGLASEIYQGASAQEVGIVEFITGRNRLYRAVIEKLPREVKVKNLVIYKTNIMCSINGVRVCIHKSANVISTVDVNGVLCYDYSPNGQDGAIKDTDPAPGQEGYTDAIVPNDNYK